jgi:hypothetical protein
MQKTLITRADDFGSSPGANDAILDALDAGFVRNAGVMAPGPFLKHRLDELRERQDTFCPGLHATLTSEWPRFGWGPVLPLDQVPSLVLPNGRFPRNSHSLKEQATLPEMMAEIAAQLERVRNFGLRPRYLDCHMGFHWLPGMAEALADFCRREGLVYANHPEYVGFPFPFDEQNITPSLPPQGRLVALFHPAYEDEISLRFDEGVAAQRDREARHLAKPAGLQETLRLLHLVPAMYC